MWVPQVGPTVDSQDPKVGPTVCGAHGTNYMFGLLQFKKNPLKSDKINSHSIYVAPHKTL